MDAIDRFHSHLDHCEQCAGNPFDLCKVGTALLLQVPAAINCTYCGEPPMVTCQQDHEIALLRLRKKQMQEKQHER